MKELNFTELRDIGRQINTIINEVNGKYFAEHIVGDYDATDAEIASKIIDLVKELL